jgi:hypothetical protein
MLTITFLGVSFPIVEDRHNTDICFAEAIPRRIVANNAATLVIVSRLLAVWSSDY